MTPEERIEVSQLSDDEYHVIVDGVDYGTVRTFEDHDGEVMIEFNCALKMLDDDDLYYIGDTIITAYHRAYYDSNYAEYK